MWKKLALFWSNMFRIWKGTKRTFSASWIEPPSPPGTPCGRPWRTPAGAWSRPGNTWKRKRESLSLPQRRKGGGPPSGGPPHFIPLAGPIFPAKEVGTGGNHPAHGGDGGSTAQPAGVQELVDSLYCIGLHDVVDDMLRVGPVGCHHLTSLGLLVGEVLDTAGQVPGALLWGMDLGDVEQHGLPPSLY